MEGKVKGNSSTPYYVFNKGDKSGQSSKEYSMFLANLKIHSLRHDPISSRPRRGITCKGSRSFIHV